MSGAGNGAPDTTTESVINHLGDNKGPASGMLRKDNSPIFGRSSIVNRGNTAIINMTMSFVATLQVVIVPTIMVLLTIILGPIPVIF